VKGKPLLRYWIASQPEHAAQVREVRHARRGAGHPEHELERAEEDDEDARLHRDRREDQHDHAPREIHPEGEEQSVEPA